jgi:hypothetical protein
MTERFAAVSLAFLITCSMSPEAVSSGSSFEQAVSGKGAVDLTGWARLKGELMIYSNRESLTDGLRFPRCISGVFAEQEKMDLSAYDGKLVTVTGTLFRYADLPDEQRPVLQRKMLSNSVVLNFCFGANVILIKTIRLANQ